MSWSFSCIGKPAAVAAAIDNHSETLTGQCRLEFNDAKPHLMALVGQNFATLDSGYQEPLIDLEASGSGSARGSEQLQRNCSVSVKPIWKMLV